MDVLRRLLEALVPGGVVVDLLAVPPNEQVEVDGEVVGELDGSRFFPRGLAAAAGLDQLVEEGLLVPAGEEQRFTILIRYPSGPESVEDVAKRTYTRMPPGLARRLERISGPVAVRESSLVRSLRKRT